MCTAKKLWSSLLLLAAACAEPEPVHPESPRYVARLAALGKTPLKEPRGCLSCHVGMYDPTLTGDAVDRVLRAHPKQDVFLKHDFSCETCHVTTDRANDPTLTPERIRRWQDINMKVHPVVSGLALKRLDRIEAVCLRCHQGEEPLVGAEFLQRGKVLYERAACYACHETEGMPKRKPGPPLDRIASKVDKTWAYNWLLHPPSFKPTARMPPFFPRGELGFPPQIIGPVEDASAVERAIAACVIEYLFDRARPAELPEPPAELFETEDWKVKDQIKRGERLVLNRGCLGCHRVEENYPPNFLDLYSFLEDEFATNLFGSGDKLDRRWLFAWLKKPSRYFPHTSMPEFGLADAEIADVVQYLLSLKVDNAARRQKGFKTWEPAEVPQVDPKILDALVAHQGGPVDAPFREKVLWEGRNIVDIFACYACHDMGGEWDRKPVVYGPLHPDLLPTRGVMERMPLMDMSEEENNLHGTYLWGQIEAMQSKGTQLRRPSLAEGERLLAKYNCQGCHILEEFKVFLRDGTSAQANIKGAVDGRWSIEWLHPRTGAGLVPEAAIDRAFPPRGGAFLQRRMAMAAPEEQEALMARMPPSLRTAGAKLRPEWMKKFLADPEPLRPGMEMPRFAFESGEIDALVDYFRRRDGGIDEPAAREVEYEAWSAADRVLRTNCIACHAIDGVGGTMSVDLGQVEHRLQRPWLKTFLKDPKSIYPRTPMPAAPEGAPLVDLLLNYGAFRRAKVERGGPEEVLEAIVNEDLARAALKRFPDPRTIERAVKFDVAAELEGLLSHRSAAVREAAVQGLVARGRFAIGDLLSDPDASVRRAALVAVKTFGRREYGAEVAALLNEPDVSLRRLALDTLEAIGSRHGIASCLRDREASIRVRAAEAMGVLGIEGVEAALQDEQASVRWAALLSMARLKASGGAEKFLEDESIAVRAAAAACLIRAGDPRGEEALGKIAAARSFDAMTERALIEAINGRNPRELLDRPAAEFDPRSRSRDVYGALCDSKGVFVTREGKLTRVTLEEALR